MEDHDDASSLLNEHLAQPALPLNRKRGMAGVLGLTLAAASTALVLLAFVAAAVGFLLFIGFFYVWGRYGSRLVRGRRASSGTFCCFRPRDVPPLPAAG